MIQNFQNEHFDHYRRNNKILTQQIIYFWRDNHKITRIQKKTDLSERIFEGEPKKTF